MKLLHTADWHLGRSLGGIPLLADQRHALEQLLDVVDDKRPDVLLIAGDIYDRALPPMDAIELLDWVLMELLHVRNLPTVIIPGNHDNAVRLGFGRRLLESSGLHLRTGLDSCNQPIEVEKDGSRLEVFAVPYAEPARVRELTRDEGAATHDTAMAALMQRLPQRRAGTRRVVMAHAFVTGGQESDSERMLSVGGSGCISAAHFGDTDYVALGHLHKPQAVEGDAVRYAGSIAKYSFSEEAHQKSYTVVTLGEDRSSSIEEIPISPLRGMRTIRGVFDDIEAEARRNPSKDFLRIELQDRSLVLDAHGRLEKYYPNIVEIYRPGLGEIAGGEALPVRLDAVGPLDHFESFFEYVRGEQLTSEERELLAEIIAGITTSQEGEG